MSVRAPVEPPALPRRRAVATVFAVVFLDLLGFGIVVPILPYYVRSFPGASDLYIGLLAATYSVTQFVAAPYLGRLSDERGRRPVVLLSLLGSVIAWTLFGVGGSLLVLFAARALAGAMGGNIAAAQAYVADVTPAEGRAQALGLLGAAFGLGFIFGPALGGLFASEPVVAFFGRVLPGFVPVTPFSLPSFAAAALSLSAFGFAAAFLVEPDRERPAGARVSWGAQFRDALRDDRLRWLVVAFFLVSVAFSGVQVMFIPFAADYYGYAESQTALLLTYVGALGVLVQGVAVGPLTRRFGSTRLAAVGAALLAVALGAIPFAPDAGRALLPAGPAFFTPELLALLLVLPVLALGNGTLSVSLTALVSDAAPREGQGAGFGVTQSAGSLGRTVGPPAMAALYLGYYWAPFVAGALFVVPVLALLLVRRAR
ncbi:MAG: MFS transporter [Halobacteriaceae archaeon]